MQNLNFDWKMKVFSDWSNSMQN